MIRRLCAAGRGQAMADLGFIASLFLLVLIMHNLDLHFLIFWVPLPVMSP